MPEPRRPAWLVAATHCPGDRMGRGSRRRVARRRQCCCCPTTDPRPRTGRRDIADMHLGARATVRCRTTALPAAAMCAARGDLDGMHPDLQRADPAGLAVGLLDRGKSGIAPLQPQRRSLVVADVELGLRQGAEEVGVGCVVQEPIGARRRPPKAAPRTDRSFDIVDRVGHTARSTAVVLPHKVYARGGPPNARQQAAAAHRPGCSHRRKPGAPACNRPAGGVCRRSAATVVSGDVFLGRADPQTPVGLGLEQPDHVADRRLDQRVARPRQPPQNGCLEVGVRRKRHGL